MHPLPEEKQGEIYQTQNQMLRVCHHEPSEEPGISTNSLAKSIHTKYSVSMDVCGFTSYCAQTS